MMLGSIGSYFDNGKPFPVTATATARSKKDFTVEREGPKILSCCSLGFFYLTCRQFRNEMEASQNNPSTTSHSWLVGTPP